MWSEERVLTVTIDLIAKHFNMDAANINKTTERDEIDGWDSVSFPGFLIVVEDTFAISLDPEIAIEVNSVGELARLIYTTLKETR
jgi:acyl carrier protein